MNVAAYEETFQGDTAQKYPTCSQAMLEHCAQGVAVVASGASLTFPNEQGVAVPTSSNVHAAVGTVAGAVPVLAT
jgi:hypothetical protein